jgi:protoporphyrinogen oxidase
VKYGASLQLQARVTGLESVPGGFKVGYLKDGKPVEIQADWVWSTIPVTILARGLKPSAPPDVLQAASGLEYRAMLLIYLVVEQEQFTPYDAHYFPGADIPITRLSEPKNYSASEEPHGRTVLCAELPCSTTDGFWSMEDSELGALVCRALETAGIPVAAPVSQVAVRRLKQAYPVYRKGYEPAFERLDEWVGNVDRLLSFGRQGLFAHDNTHHALYMAYSAAECLNPDGLFDQARWAAFRRVFATHVVED